MKNKTISNISGDNWATPKWFYDKLDAEFSFDFDPCPLNTGIIPPDKDGLVIEWGERNYINPPYSRKLKTAFVKRAVLEKENGKLCVLLLPVSTSTSLFHDVIQPNATEIRFVRGRIAFEGVNTKGEYTTTGKPMHDSMIVIMDGRR